MNASVNGGPNYTDMRTASDLIETYPGLQGKDGIYLLYPEGPSGEPRRVFCDMTTNGGGYMLVARTHPDGEIGEDDTWGWDGDPIGDVDDFTQPYQCGWNIWSSSGAFFNEFIVGNRKNVFTNEFGPSIYRFHNIVYFGTGSDNTGTGSDGFIFSTTGIHGQNNVRVHPISRTVIQNDTSVYSYTGVPNMMQTAGMIGANSDTNQDRYGFGHGGNTVQYGMQPNRMKTAHLNSYNAWSYAGPWKHGQIEGEWTSSNGDFLGNSSEYSVTLTDADGLNPRIHGGSNQCMIFVR